MDKQKYLNFFYNYADKFISDAANDSEKLHLTRKKEHTLRVVKYAMDISESMELDKKDIDLVYLISLFHDIGRFYQFKKYHTYVDSKSENHSEIAMQILNKENILKDFDVSTKEIIKKCIYVHNMKDVPKYLNIKEYLYATILRDADKLDILYSAVNIIPTLPQKDQDVFYSSLGNDLTISDEVYYSILNNETISLSSISNKIEKQVTLIGMITSNYVHLRSYEIINENNFLELMVDLMPHSKRVTDIYNHVKNFITKKIENT